MSQKSFQQMRQSFIKERRKQQLDKRFASRRKQLVVQCVEKEKQTFAALLPSVNQQNYEQHKSILSDYARSETYSYEMLPITFIVYEYLLGHPHDEPSWQIVTYLSYYQDFQIAQSQQFAEIIMNRLDLDPQLISQLVLNLSKLPKCGLLCCRLVDCRIVDSIQQRLLRLTEDYWRQSLQSRDGEFRAKDKMQLQIWNFLITLCYLFIVQPLLELHQMAHICKALNPNTKSNRFLKQTYNFAIFKLIQNAIENLSHHPEIFHLLIQTFQPAIEKNYYSYESQSINFIDCCIKNQIILPPTLIKNLINSIKSHEAKTKIAALKVLQKILSSASQVQKMQVEPNKLHTLQPFIDNKLSISLEQFSTMFTSTQSKLQNHISQNQIKNCRTFLSLTLTENYQEVIKTLYSIFQGSTQNIQQEIAGFMSTLVKAIVREIYNDYDNKMINVQEQISVHENFKYFLDLTIKENQTFYFLASCLNSPNIQIVKSGLQVLKDFLLYYGGRDSEFSEVDIQEDKQFVKRQIQKSKIQDSLQKLMKHQNKDISVIAEDILQILDQNQSQTI